MFEMVDINTFRLIDLFGSRKRNVCLSGVTDLLRGKGPKRPINIVLFFFLFFLSF